MGATRPTGRADAVAERLRALDRHAFVEFCAALWRVRGYETRRAGDRFVASRSDERLVVRPVSTGCVARVDAALRWRLRSDASVGGGGDDTVGNVDVVVAPADGEWASRLADRHDARFVGPDTLVDLLLYGVSRTDADALTDRFLGASTTTLLAEAEPRPGRDESRLATPTTLAAVVGVVCLVLAAGVAGVWGPVPAGSGGDAASTSPTGAEAEPSTGVDSSATSTPDSDGESEEPSAPRYPPGIGADSLDASVLARAHADAVSRQSYRLIVRQSDTDALDGDRRWDGVWQHAVVESEETWLYTVVGYESRANGSELVQYTLYTGGEFVYRRADTRNGTRYDRYPLRVDDYGVHTDRSRQYVRRYLSTTAVEVDRVSWRPDEHRVVATGRPRYVDGNVTNYTATAFVHESGFVSELTVEFTREAAADDDDRTASFRMEYAAVGDTETRPPGWYDEARSATAANATQE